MFDFKSSFGNHEIYKYDVNKHPFIDYFKSLFNEDELYNLHFRSNDYNEVKDVLYLGYLNDKDTDLHRIFYNDIKSNDLFKKLYCNFVKDIYKDFFPQEEIMIFQSFPSIRIQYMESVVVPPHYDSDHLSNHPLGEKNFLIPITNMENTNTIFIESEPNKKDFKNINLEPGELFYFNGNSCTHYNEKNRENKLRISLDFRIIKLKDYMNYILNNDVKKTNPRDIQKDREATLMLIGGYYQSCNVKSSIDDMMNWYKIHPIMQHRPTFEKEEALATYNYMNEDNFITEHTKTKELEQIISTYLGCKHCIMTTSGTMAIILSMMSLNLKEGDEVIVPNYTMIATINAVKFLKLVPIIIDVDPETYTLSCEEIKNNITLKTKCIIHVSLNNRYTRLNDIVKLCNDRNIHLIEDSAQSLGCKFDGKFIGTFGKIGCFSLSTPKIISTGQGGFCVTDNDELAKQMNMIKNFGRRESGKDDFEVFGVNFKYTDLQAVICIEQMKKLDYRVKKMKDIYNLYYNNLKDVVKMIPPLNDEWLPWFVDIYIQDREELINFLKIHKIGVRPVYGEINKTNIYNSNVIFKNSNYVCSNGLFLPSYITLNNNEILYICKLIKLYYLHKT